MHHLPKDVHILIEKIMNFMYNFFSKHNILEIFYSENL